MARIFVKGVVGILPTEVKGEEGRLKGDDNSEIFLPVYRFGYPPKSIELIESIFLNRTTRKMLFLTESQQSVMKILSRGRFSNESN